MSRTRLDKGTLSSARQKLRLYGQLLPSLDLKRRQLTLELARARRACAEAERVAEQLERRVGESLPMLANPRMTLSGLVRVEELVLGEENVLGVRLPRLERIDFAVLPYSLLARPAWVDGYVRRLSEGVRARIEARLAARRVALLEQGTRRVTQRVHLFERVLIPEAQRTIQRMRILMGDRERDAVVRSKIAKARQARRRGQVGA